ncbi:MAG: hypothetical protein ACKOEE_13320 [Tagaea sp.]|nr:hypothetical protein [Azospirillum sp.]MCA3264727.1 hypothetical protein [Azospirillum sp.]MCZ8124830.1 hypothetical protein [Magnetospirillum sp.]
MPFVPILSEISYDFQPPNSAIVVYGADTPWGRLEVEVTVTERGVYGLEVFHQPNRGPRAPFRPSMDEAFHWTTLEPEQAALYAATGASRYLELRSEGETAMDAAQFQRLLAELMKR